MVATVVQVEEVDEGGAAAHQPAAVSQSQIRLLRSAAVRLPYSCVARGSAAAAVTDLERQIRENEG